MLCASMTTNVSSAVVTCGIGWVKVEWRLPSRVAGVAEGISFYIINSIKNLTLKCGYVILISIIDSPIAQLVEQYPVKVMVAGSTPARGANLVGL